MKRIIALIFPLFVLFSTIIAVVALEVRRTPGWEAALSDYITWSRLPAETIKFQTVVKARKPWNFMETMGQAVRHNQPWGVTEIPFPPAELQCVLLERSRKATIGVKEATQRQIVFVAYHTDKLWQVGWVVHEGPAEPFPPELAAHLKQIGCNLSLE